jgi:hypothetical protein
MRPIDRILGRQVTETASFAVRPYGTTASEAQATDQAATAASSGTTTNLTTGGSRPISSGGITNRGEQV